MNQKNNKIKNVGMINLFGEEIKPEDGEYNDVWITPIPLFKLLNSEFHFDVDVATEKNNPLNLKKFYTKEDNSLNKEWIGNVWLNPPYSDIATWIKKAAAEFERDNKRKIVLLIPARTDTKYFHKFIVGKAEVRFVEGRLKFSKRGSAPFPSMIVIYGNTPNIIAQERGY